VSSARLLVVLILLAGVLIVPGCAGLLGVLLAPQSVVASTAATIAMQAGSAASSVLTEADGMAQTLGDLDRVIAANPDAVNADQMRGMRGDLKKELDAVAPGSKAKGQARPPPASEFDRRATAPDGGTQAALWKQGPGGVQRTGEPSDTLVLERPRPLGGAATTGRDARSADQQRFASTQPGTLQAAPTRVYSGSNRAIRLSTLDAFAPGAPGSSSEVRRPGP